MPLGERYGLRWFLDASELSPLAWQAGPIIGLILLLLLLPAIAFKANIVLGQAYGYAMAPYKKNSPMFQWLVSQWLVVMTGRRIVLSLLSLMIPTPYVRSIVVVLYMITLLVVDLNIKPFVNKAVQRMESISLSLLVMLAALQVRAATLVGAAKSVDAGPYGSQEELAMLWLSWTLLVVPGVFLAAASVYDSGIINVSRFSVTLMQKAEFSGESSQHIPMGEI